MTIPIKNKEAIGRMRDAGAVAATVLDALKPLVRPGITTQDLEEAGREWMARLGARSAPYGYQREGRRCGEPEPAGDAGSRTAPGRGAGVVTKHRRVGHGRLLQAREAQQEAAFADCGS